MKQIAVAKIYLQDFPSVEISHKDVQRITKAGGISTAVKSRPTLSAQSKPISALVLLENRDFLGGRFRAIRDPLKDPDLPF